MQSYHEDSEVGSSCSVVHRHCSGGWQLSHSFTAGTLAFLHFGEFGDNSVAPSVCIGDHLSHISIRETFNIVCVFS